jgi:chromosome segregation ATPase
MTAILSALKAALSTIEAADRSEAEAAAAAYRELVDALAENRKPPADPTAVLRRAGRTVDHLKADVENAAFLRELQAIAVKLPAARDAAQQAKARQVAALERWRREKEKLDAEYQRALDELTHARQVESGCEDADRRARDAASDRAVAERKLVAELQRAAGARPAVG